MGKSRTYRVVGLRDDGSQTVLAKGISHEYAEKVVRLLLLRFGYNAFTIEPEDWVQSRPSDSARIPDS